LQKLKEKDAVIESPFKQLHNPHLVIPPQWNFARILPSLSSNREDQRLDPHIPEWIEKAEVSTGHNGGTSVGGYRVFNEESSSDEPDGNDLTSLTYGFKRTSQVSNGSAEQQQLGEARNHQTQNHQTRNHTLPFEVLGAIFQHIPTRSPFDLRPLLFVCKSWRNAVCQHSSLWSTITLDRTMYAKFVVDDIFQESLAADYLRCCLKYSGTTPLAIILYFKRRTHEWYLPSIEAEILIETRLVSLLRVVVGEEEGHFARWHSFTWYTPMANLPTILSILPLTLPNLRTVKLFKLLHQGALDIAFPCCPNLRTVELQEYNRLLLRETDCAQATKFTLGTDTVWVDEDVEVLCKFGNLRRLTLSALPNPSYSSSRFPSKIKTEVLFPHLHRLKLLGKPAREIIRLIEAPALKRVEFDDITAFDIFKYASFASVVQTVYIMHGMVYNDNATLAMLDSISKRVMGLLAFPPRLQRIRLPKSIQEKLGSDVLQFEKRGIRLELTRCRNFM
jgi:hypothetical protein